MSSGFTAEMPVLSASTLDGVDPSCAQCGADLEDDQEWCLDCGAARTLIHRAPDWRVPVAIGCVIVALVFAGFVIALVNLSSTTNARTAAAPPAAAASPPARSTTPTAAAAPVPPRIGSWPVGSSGWTVVLFTSRSQTRAETAAIRLATHGLGVGVLSSSQHPDLAPGYWVVFTGRYPHGSEAAAAAARLKASGHPSARPRQVARPGGR